MTLTTRLLSAVLIVCLALIGANLVSADNSNQTGSGFDDDGDWCQVVVPKEPNDPATSCCFYEQTRTNRFCFNNKPPFDHLPVPLDVEIPKFYLVRLAPNGTLIDKEIHDSTDLGRAKSKNGRNRDVILLIHGLAGSRHGCKNWADPVLKSLLERKGHYADVVFVDWERGAQLQKKKAIYAQPASNARITGIMVAHFFSNGTTIVNPSRKWCIGFSLGAHVCSFAAKELKDNFKTPFRSIIGLDPAGPCFHRNDPKSRLDKTDADFVAVLHSSWFGLRSDVGHADFYINGGYYQPGCSRLGALMTTPGITMQAKICQDEDIVNDLADLEQHVGPEPGAVKERGQRLKRRFLYEMMSCSHERVAHIFAASLSDQCYAKYSHTPDVDNSLRQNAIQSSKCDDKSVADNAAISPAARSVLCSNEPIQDWKLAAWLGYRALDANFTSLAAAGQQNQRNSSRSMAGRNKRIGTFKGVTADIPPYCLFIITSGSTSSRYLASAIVIIFTLLIAEAVST